ncbi:TOG array regulator of axonemal microtubules protein 1 [Tanacetum coccineum]
MEGLESKDWLKVSLKDVTRFALFHSVLLLPIMEKVMKILVKSMKNPRSALCKTTIMMLQLLLKASQDKKFVCEEAERTLKTMVVSTTSIPLLYKVKVYATHGNMRVRAKAVVSIAQCVSKMFIKSCFTSKEVQLCSFAMVADIPTADIGFAS